MPQLDLQHCLEVGIKAAKAAGQLMLERVNGPMAIQTKSSRVDLVTEVDLACDALIRDILSSAFSSHQLLTEETYKEGEITDFTPSTWIVDPIDGTTNFAHGYPYSSVSIGLMQNNQMQVGVIFDPYRDECFTAIRGETAKLNDQPIQVSKVNCIDNTLIATGFAFRREEQASVEKIKQLARVLEACHDIRRLGSAAIDLAYVACGRQDAFYESHLGPWDVAAGWLIVECAGGKFTSFTNDRLDFKTKRQDIVATNGAFHDVLLGLIH